ncbi:MAG TPA: hypothetical protein VJJ23_05635 [Candidatus Nanoarchaeia archaeon]|nr:hypothetical protein [Candidatus Pacearchaeota archaeon]HLC56690.1 hypothetical protein [Candidatus Nanoarchaeia archaeon]
MNSDRSYNGNVNAGELGADLMGLYIDSESRRIETLSKITIDRGVELIIDIRKERQRKRYLAHVMSLRV